MQHAQVTLQRSSGVTPSIHVVYFGSMSAFTLIQHLIRRVQPVVIMASTRRPQSPFTNTNGPRMTRFKSFCLPRSLIPTDCFIQVSLRNSQKDDFDLSFCHNRTPCPAYTDASHKLEKGVIT